MRGPLPALLSLASLACTADEPLTAISIPPDPRPTVLLAVPATGPDLDEGLRAERGVSMALGDAFALRTVDAGDAAALEPLLHMAGVVGLVVWAPEADPAPFLRAWESSDLFVIAASKDAPTALPRVIPDLPARTRCARSLLPAGRFVLVGDGSARSAEVKSMIAAQPGLRMLRDLVVDLRRPELAVQGVVATKPERVVYVGGPRSAAAFLRALRDVDERLPVYALDLYEEAFLTEAGRAAEGVRVTTSHRPAWDERFLASYEARYGELPSPSVVDAHDAALFVRELREATLVTAGGREGLRLNLPRISARGLSGSFRLDEGLAPNPSFCSLHEVREGRFVWTDAARLEGSAVRRLRAPEEPIPRAKRAPAGFLRSPPRPVSEP